MSQDRMDELDGLIFIDHAVAKDGRRDELVALLREGVEMMASREPGLLTATIFVSPTNPNLVASYWYYESEEAHAEHRASVERLPEYQDLGKRLFELLAEPLSMEQFTPVARLQRR